MRSALLIVRMTGLNPFKKKKPKVQEDKNDLKENYTTEDHKVDLDELLNKLGTNLSQVRLGL